MLRYISSPWSLCRYIPSCLLFSWRYGVAFPRFTLYPLIANSNTPGSQSTIVICVSTLPTRTTNIRSSPLPPHVFKCIRSVRLLCRSLLQVTHLHCSINPVLTMRFVVSLKRAADPDGGQEWRLEHFSSAGPYSDPSSGTRVSTVCENIEMNPPRNRPKTDGP